MGACTMECKLACSICTTCCSARPLLQVCCSLWACLALTRWPEGPTLALPTSLVIQRDAPTQPTSAVPHTLGAADTRLLLNQEQQSSTKRSSMHQGWPGNCSKARGSHPG